MLAILRPDIDEDSPEYKRTWEALVNLPGIELNVRTI
jgi:hypothetical protein